MSSLMNQVMKAVPQIAAMVSLWPYPRTDIQEVRNLLELLGYDLAPKPIHIEKES